MRLQAMGPDRVQSRIAEIQAKLDAQFGKPDTGFEIPSEPVMPGVNANPIQGAIGGKASESESPVSPMNPFGPGAEVKGFQPAKSDVRAMIESAAGKSGVDAHLLEALVSVESDFNPRTVSKAGAKGLTQLMPGTALALGVTDPMDPQQSLDGGAKYLSQLLRQYEGNQTLALAAYNAGPGAVQRAGGVPPYRETQNYVRNVMARYEALKNGAVS